ncbi:GNAT family N-acetyltransferase [Clostridium sp. DJ247]|uniref:GNAT family N-acetyltransferase n=1 Tax=Clostridium sp. DJ247 TaxID=2726188 RepID=UPI001629EACC|nr:GNAT family N-acetyltransferase [Clostridium sp. DJ247]MBC2581441.1 GNAT family N-acetyltransferase [Clostridium sp. DJ247]
MEFKLITSEFEKGLFVNEWEDAWEDAFDRKLDSQFSSWIFNSRNNMYAIFEEDKIVAGYCLLNNKVVYNGNIVDGALCNNVFVRPSYQGLNLFVKLGRYALQKAAEQGIKIAIGMPNKNAVPGHRRVGWTFLNQVYFLEKSIVPCSSETILTDNIKVLNRDNYHMYEDQLEMFSMNISSQRTFSVLKDKNYFKWRYVERPSVNYKIFTFIENDTVLGYVVYKFYEVSNRLHIVDIEAANEEVFYALLKLTDSFKESFNLVNAWSSSIYHNYFLKAGFSLSTEYNNLIAIRPQVKEPVLLGDKVNIVLGDNEVF